MVHMGIVLGIITGIGADFTVDYFSRFVHALLSQLAFLNIAPNHFGYDGDGDHNQSIIIMGGTDCRSFDRSALSTDD